MGGVKVAATCLHWSQPSVPHSPSSSQTLASAISSPSLKRRSLSTGDGILVCRSGFLGNSYSKLYRTGSWEQPKPKTFLTRRKCSASFDSFSDEEFSKRIQELALKFQISADDDEILSDNGTAEAEDAEIGSESISGDNTEAIILENHLSFDPLKPPDWPERDEIIPASIERKANSVDLPLSLRIIKRKKQWEEGFREAGESAYCSVKKAFSSMVFIIRELQSYTLQMREMLFYEDLQGILVRVQKEMHASFVWLFQQVFSHTPTFMVYVMILLANYSVYSMASNPALAATQHDQVYAASIESVSEVGDHTHGNPKFDSSSIKSFSVSSSSGRTASIGGSNGGGGKYRPIANGTDGDGMFDRITFDHHRSIIPDGPSRTSEEESVSGQVTREEEMRLWNSMVDEASKMQSEFRDEALDHDTMQSFVSPIHAKIDEDDYVDYFHTQMMYQTVLDREPTNTLLLANYAQFLYLVIQDYDRYRDSSSISRFSMPVFFALDFVFLCSICLRESFRICN
ncbi:OLC1v1006203C2 [Oldenlandia corymbosa var. corymbosa]|uniref:OLC1v1006203C2 n=1 Tax=Oldenlandia corymbosa var. corymbosa TaxID=529605 RepID=A0AAV1DHT2_OLDCO|nr:OLC1v1006203C2 [Oldenlandia corymbosa var. corymbosa]